MTQAIVIIKETKTAGNASVKFHPEYAYHNYTDPACAEPINTTIDNISMHETIMSTGPFEIDPTYVADIEPGNCSIHFYVKYGCENGPGKHNSLTRSQRYIVRDTAQVAGWPVDNDPATIVQLWRQSKTAISSNTALDPNGESNLYWTWATTVYNPEHAISLTAEVTIV